jgi:hypothetical protein
VTFAAIELVMEAMLPDKMRDQQSEYESVDESGFPQATVAHTIHTVELFYTNGPFTNRSHCLPKQFLLTVMTGTRRIHRPPNRRPFFPNIPRKACHAMTNYQARSVPRRARRASRVAAIAVLTMATAATVTYGATTAIAGQREHSTVACEPGSACLWTEVSYAGSLYTWDLRTANPGDCIALRAGESGRSLGNRLDRDLTLYADVTCSEEKAKQIYPGGGTFAPRNPFPVAAIKIGS